MSMGILNWVIGRNPSVEGQDNPHYAGLDGWMRDFEHPSYGVLTEDQENGQGRPVKIFEIPLGASVGDFVMGTAEALGIEKARSSHFGPVASIVPRKIAEMYRGNVVPDDVLDGLVASLVGSRIRKSEAVMLFDRGKVDVLYNGGGKFRPGSDGDNGLIGIFVYADTMKSYS